MPQVRHLVFEQAVAACFLSKSFRTPSFGVLHRICAVLSIRLKVLISMGLRIAY
jgi:hypothetical protein